MSASNNLNINIKQNGFMINILFTNQYNYELHYLGFKQMVKTFAQTKRLSVRNAMISAFVMKGMGLCAGILLSVRFHRYLMVLNHALKTSDFKKLINITSS